MRVLVAHNRYVSESPSGENVAVDNEIRMLEAAGVSVIPYLPSSDSIADMSTPGRLALPVSPVYAVPGVSRVRELIRDTAANVLHLHNPYPLISPAVVRMAQRHGVAVVQTVHNFRHTCARGTHFRDGHECLDCLRHHFPYPAIQHACYRSSRPQSTAMAIGLAAHRTTWNHVDHFVALTPLVADYLRRTSVSTPVTVKPNVVPDPGGDDSVGAGFLYAGRLVEEKGIRLLLSAWCRHPDGALGQLGFAGDGPLRGEVEDAAASRSDIRFLGHVAPSDLAGLFRRTAVVVAPSVWDEICPVVVIEAMARSRPVLATATGGLPFLVENDGGWLVEPTGDGLAEGLRRAHDGAGRSVNAAARARYVREFAPAALTARLVEVYEAAVGARHAAAR
jgi:glycosyltransferase involved in cell wall biosynthesis